MGEGYKLLGLGMTFAGGIIVFMVLGLLLDRWLGSVPLFTVLGTLVGAALSFINVYVKLGLSGRGRNGRELGKRESGVASRQPGKRVKRERRGPGRDE